MTARKPLTIVAGQRRQLQATETLQLFACTTANASQNCPHGTAPTSPVNGDLWTTTAGLYVRINGTTVGPLGTSAGDFAGPGSSTTDHFVTFADGTGKVGKDSGLSLDTDGTLAANSDTKIPSQKAVKTYADAGDAATLVSAKAYTDAVAQGLSIRDSCRLATAAALPANVYSNGASGVGATLTAVSTGVLTIDGVAAALGNRVLVKNEVAGANNGIYTVTTAGAIGVLYVLTRATDYDQAADIFEGTFTLIEEGTANAASGWVMITSGAVTVGTTALSFTQFSAAGSLSAASTTDILTGTDTAKYATSDAIAALWEQGADVASAGTVTFGEGGFFHVTGTTTITDIDLATDKAGRTIWVEFTSALTLTHNSSTLILPGGTSIVTVAGDTACFVSEASDVVRCLYYSRSNGQAIVQPTLTAPTLRSSAQSSFNNSTITHTFPSGAAAGDACILFVGHAFAVNDPDGWIKLDNQSGSNVNGAIYVKELTSADISTGSVTITFTGSFNGAVMSACFTGRPGDVRFPPAFYREGFGITSKKLQSPWSTLTTDYVLYFGYNRAADSITIDQGSSLQALNASNASASLYGGVPGAAGAKTATFTYPTAGSGSYSAIVCFKGA